MRAAMVKINACPAGIPGLPVTDAKLQKNGHNAKLSGVAPCTARPASRLPSQTGLLQRKA
jgi:hypothetical protein